MNLVLFDHHYTWQSLLPLTFTKPIAALRVGILTISEKWSMHLKHNNPSISYLCADYLNGKFSSLITDDNYFINSALLPNHELYTAILSLQYNQALVDGDIVLAVRGKSISLGSKSSVAYTAPYRMILNTWDIFAYNGIELRSDFVLITEGRISSPIEDAHTIVYGKENIFLEEGVKIRAAILNAEEGPIYLGKNTEIHEGAIIKGAFALCNNSHVNMASKMRGDTTIGPYSKVGGEISNSVIQGYSNKAHDGFIGNAVIGEWCNLGADTNCSNLKNNYTEVEVFNYAKQKYINTGRLFCGLVMGDHSKAGINTMFNTGTVLGFCTNVYGGGFPPKFIPSFSWCDTQHVSTYKLEKAIETAKNMYARRNMLLQHHDVAIFEYLFQNR
jgi:UDP-N-acetylglucosamine diphosphorylase/glucosamine-1-phosphate N-acetyltransferase